MRFHLNFMDASSTSAAAGSSGNGTAVHGLRHLLVSCPRLYAHSQPRIDQWTKDIYLNNFL